MPDRRFIHIGFFAGAGIIIQLLTYFTGTGYFLTQLTMSSYYAIVIIGLCMLMGYAGQISIGHAGFFAIGGYLSSAMTTHDLTPFKGSLPVRLLDSIGFLVDRQGLYGEQILHFQPWVSFIFAVLVTVAIAYLIGGPVLKLKGHYLAMATLGFGTIIYSIVIGTPVFGEADGISDVPAFALLPGLTVSGKMSVRIENFYIAWGLMSICMLLLLNLVNSRVGRALRSIHSAEDAANAMGVDTATYKLRIFVISAVFASVAGVLMTHFNGGIGPSEASIMKSVRYVAIVAVGGMANLWGALIMGLVLNFLSLRGYFGSLDDAVFGGILIVIMLFSPKGLLRKETLSYMRDIVLQRGSEEDNA
ncbi:MAG: branched-chain amino acid ABC transporter permease [Nitrospirota bacterium]|nr:MAG: branched-chain amino acid ABC transporter permease [Nitrospirota bacterium]